MKEFLINFDWAYLLLSMLTFGVLAIWFVVKFQSRLDDHARRIAALERNLTTLADKVDALHTDMMKGFADVQVALANKKERE